MFKRKFWVNIGYATDKSTRNTHDRYSNSGSHGVELGSGIHIRSGNRKPHDPYSLTQIGVTRMGSESEEEIVRAEDKANMDRYSPQSHGPGIMVERTVEIERTSDRSLDNASDPSKNWFNAV